MAVKTQLSIEQRRAALFNLGFRSKLAIAPATFTAGGQLDVRLPKAGVLLGLYILMSGVIARASGTSTDAVSGLGPLSFISNLQLKDAAGITRISASGANLHKLEQMQRWAYKESTMSDTSVWAHTAPASGATGAIVGSVYVPVSIHPNSSIGAIPLTIPQGETLLSMQFSAVAGASQFQPIKATDATLWTLSSGSVYVGLDYIEPSNDAPLPYEDFGFIHEIIEQTFTDNLAASTEKRVTLQSGRTYERIIANLVDNALMSENVDKIGFIVDGASPIMNEYYAMYKARIAKEKGIRPVAGFYEWDFSDRPYTPDKYGQLDLSLTLNSSFSGTSPKLTVMSETLYKTAQAATY